MAGNSWQQPVAGEPSWGTFHPHYSADVLNNVDPADTNWTAVDLSGHVPVGAKMVKIRVQCLSATTGHRMQFSGNSDGAQLWLTCYINTGSAINEVQGDVPLSTERYIYRRANNAGIYGLYLTVLGYYI